MTFAFEGIIGASVTLAICYLSLIVYIIWRLKDLNSTGPILKSLTITPIKAYNTFNNIQRNVNASSPDSIRSQRVSGKLNTKKVFVMTILLSSLLRFMSFSSMALFDITATHYTFNMSIVDGKFDDNITGTEEFFEKAFIVLFDFPDFCFISAYLLLMVVWAEAYLESRRHWLSSVTFRRFWILGYLFLNITIYFSQIALYTLLFLPSVDKNLLSALIFLTLTGYNLVMPLLWLLIFIYLSCRFAGFPFKSNKAKIRLEYLGQCVFIWTITRILWGIVTLSSVLKGWLRLLSDTSIGRTFILISIFLVVEIFPISFCLQSTVLESLIEDTDDVECNLEMRYKDFSNLSIDIGSSPFYEKSPFAKSTNSSRTKEMDSSVKYNYYAKVIQQDFQDQRTAQLGDAYNSEYLLNRKSSIDDQKYNSLLDDPVDSNFDCEALSSISTDSFKSAKSYELSSHDISFGINSCSSKNMNDSQTPDSIKGLGLPTVFVGRKF